MQIRSILERSIASQKLGKNILISICRNCGLPLSSSYTKSRLVDIISTGLSEEPLVGNKSKAVGNSHFKILSIDVGIKNFSFCKLQIDAKNPFDKPIAVKEWAKLNLMNWTNNSIDMEFSPQNYSVLSEELIFKFILQKEVPDLILIERQRFRSMGSSNVLEHVIRSAVLENMLFASLNILKRYDTKLQYLVQSSSPLIMTSYWETYRTLDNQVLDKVSAVSKKQRIELVSNWILNNTNKRKLIIPEIDDEYKLKISKIKNHSRKLFEIVSHINGNDGERIDTEKQKGDDLADSLLHGITWIDFEKNKSRIIEVLKSSPDQLIDELRSIEREHISEINEARIAYSESAKL